MNGPICEYCGSVLGQEKIEQIAYNFKQTQWAWEESVIQAELMRNLLQQKAIQQINSGFQSQICCDTRTQINQSILQSQNYIQTPPLIAISEKETKDFGYEYTFWVWVIIVMLLALAAVLFAAFLA